MFENPQYCFLEKLMLFLLALKWNLFFFFWKAFSHVKTKANSNIAVKLTEMSNHSFLLSIRWIPFFKHLCSLMRDDRMYNWFIDCVNTWKRSRAAKQLFFYRVLVQPFLCWDLWRSTITAFSLYHFVTLDDQCTSSFNVLWKTFVMMLP